MNGGLVAGNGFAGVDRRLERKRRLSMVCSKRMKVSERGMLCGSQVD